MKYTPVFICLFVKWNYKNKQILQLTNKTFVNRTYFINLPRSKLTDFIYT